MKLLNRAASTFIAQNLACGFDVIFVFLLAEDSKNAVYLKSWIEAKWVGKSVFVSKSVWSHKP